MKADVGEACPDLVQLFEKVGILLALLELGICIGLLHPQLALPALQQTATPFVSHGRQVLTLISTRS